MQAYYDLFQCWVRYRVGFIRLSCIYVDVCLWNGNQYYREKKCNILKVFYLGFNHLSILVICMIVPSKVVLVHMNISFISKMPSSKQKREKKQTKVRRLKRNRNILFERKWHLTRNLATMLPLKSKLSGKFQPFNAIDKEVSKCWKIVEFQLRWKILRHFRRPKQWVPLIELLIPIDPFP